MYSCKIIRLVNFITDNSSSCFDGCKNLWDKLWNVSWRNLDHLVAYGNINFSMFELQKILVLGESRCSKRTTYETCRKKLVHKLDSELDRW